MATPKDDESRQSPFGWVALVFGGFFTVLAWASEFRSFIHHGDPVVIAYLIATVLLFGVATLALSGTPAGRQNAGAVAKGLLPVTGLLLAICADKYSGPAAWASLVLVLISIVLARMSAANWPDPP